MGNYDVKVLFRKLSQGTISDEELTYLNNWMASNEEEDLATIMDNDWSKFNHTEELNQPPKWMDQSANRPTIILQLFRNRQWMVAASIILLIVSGIAFFGLKNFRTPQLVTKSNPKELKKLIKLPDGSKVWLKRNSTLSYWRPFKNSERVFNLEGEAYFEVVTDSTKPFIVHAQYLTTRVLGTSFNIISGNTILMPEVALVEGEVEVSYTRDSIKGQPVRLKPGQKVMVNTYNHEVLESSYKENYPYAWKDDKLAFEKADVHEVAHILEEWYNIEFKVDSGNFEPNALVHRYDPKILSLQKVLRDISLGNPYRFHLQEDGSYIIKPKRKN